MNSIIIKGVGLGYVIHPLFQGVATVGPSYSYSPSELFYILLSILLFMFTYSCFSFSVMVLFNFTVPMRMCWRQQE